jgi:hypothetical protein
MIAAPLANAGVSTWNASNSINTNGTSITVRGFEVPGNSTILDGWMHVTDSTMATSLNNGIIWEGSDFDGGTKFGTFIDDNDRITIKDDGTRSNISTFDEGDINVVMNSKYKYTPGWRLVYSVDSETNVSECGGLAGKILQYGLDNDFNSQLNDIEIISEIYYCETFSKEDTIQQLNIISPGDGYSNGNLSATGGGGQNFSATYIISTGIDSISINNAGSGYDTSDAVTIICVQCDGENANASISSVDSNGGITGITVDDAGDGYTGDDTIFISVSGSGGNGASLAANLQSTGMIHSTEITNEGSNYTSTPTIVISDSAGTGASISASLGDYFEYELDIDTVSSGNSNCQYGGIVVKSGLDYNNNRNLGSDEIQNEEYFCNTIKTWQATTFTGLGGITYGSQQNMSYGVIPSEATNGVVAIGTTPGEPLPAGTNSSFLIPSVSVPLMVDQNNYFLSFDHWYHVDSTSSGGGDGAWIEYRVKESNNWGDWTYVAPNSGYPSTMSTDAHTPNGAPSGAVPVFASSNYSGWVTSTFDLSPLVSENSSNIQFRFNIWTHPDAENERPGWFIDNILFNNDGISYGAWHHGCYTQTASSCYYSSNAYGSLNRVIDLSGTNSTSKIEIDMEWDLEGSSVDNACVEVSLNQNTWYDISSTGTTSTSSDCANRDGAIPGTGYTAANGQSYGDQSGRTRTIELTIPNSFLNEPTVYFRIVVDTDYYNNWGGTLDAREGLTVDEIRVVDYSNSILFVDDLDSLSSMTHNPIGASADDWQHLVLLRGAQTVRMGFEDSTASAPSITDASGWSRTNSMSSGSCSGDTCKWTLNKINSNSGPGGTASFPYAYGIAFSGSYSSYIQEARLFSPSYDIPANGNAFLTFDHWTDMEPNWDGGAVFIKVNNGSWQHFDPGNWYDSQVSYNYNNLYGYDTFSSQSSANGGMKNMQASLLNYQGDTVRFKFSMGSDGYDNRGGWFIDNAGVKVANYGNPGDWLSPSFSIGDFDDFNLGIIDVDALIPENTSIRASLIDSSTNLLLPGYSDVSLPLSLAGIDADNHPQIKLKLHLTTSDPEATPAISKISIGGKRFLNADSGNNGWTYSSGVEVVNDLLNATLISGTLISDFTPSSRPIKALNVGGNISNGVTVTALNKNGGSLGSASKGGSIVFSTIQTGFGLSVNLPTNAWIDRLVVTAVFAEPASNPVIDVLDDEILDWSFPRGDSYGHYGWQSTLAGYDSSESPVISKTVALDGSNPEQFSIYIPAEASVTSGIISISPDHDGFESVVTLTVAGSSQSGPLGDNIFYNTLSSSQISGISLISGTHTDPDTGRLWRDVPIELDSNTAQTITISRIGINYFLFENISGLEDSLSEYHESTMNSFPDYEEVEIPVTFSADIGSISIDGDIVYDFLIQNRDFSVPNTFYPTGDPVQISTSHHHLYDNAELSEITLTGTASDGNVIIFKVENSADGLWGSGTGPVSFSQISGSDKAPLDLSSSYVDLVANNDGGIDVVVNWIFDISWYWDDVEEIYWVSRANDINGDTIWPAEQISGKSGAQAVENDLQIDYFEVYDSNGRLISNIYDNLFYPFPILEGSELNINGKIRFQDSSSHRPLSSDFTVGLNISGNIYSLNSNSDGEFSGTINSPTGQNEITLSPIIISIGPPTGSFGADDVTGQPPLVDIVIDKNPPIAGPIQINTPIGLQLADGMVSDPTTPFRPYITVSESEARGDSVTLKYWRTGLDDINGDGIASENEYQSQLQSLTPGLTGEQQIQFSAIDVSSLDNEPILLYVEGSDWAGLTYSDGGTGGGPGEENSWARVIIAVDEPTQFAGDSIGIGGGQNSAFDLDRRTSDNVDFYLLPDVLHTFSLQIDDPNGINTLDNITIMLCGYGTNLGLFTYAPYSGKLWSPGDSMVTPINYQTEVITNSVSKIYLSFKLSWDFPWDEDSVACKPRVTVDDNLITVAESDVLSALSWKLDNKISAIPEGVYDLTLPIMESIDNELYLKQNDEFSISGAVYYAGSGERLLSIPDGLGTQIKLIYGSQELTSDTLVESDGSFNTSLELPPRAPSNPVMPISTEVTNLPGLSSSLENSAASVTVDSDSPTARFNQEIYPDSSLTSLGTDSLSNVLVTISIVDEFGMQEGPLMIEWEYIRAGGPIVGTQTSGELSLISFSDGVSIYQSRIDFTPIIDLTFQPGDQVSVWINSKDKAGNPIIGLGSEDTPRMPTLRIMEFLGQYTREITTPTKIPAVGDVLTIVTYWENPGKLDGTISLGLWEKLPDGSWKPSLTTQKFGDQEVFLESGSTSVLSSFEYETWQEGSPYLVIVVDGDFDNVNGMQQEIVGINVGNLPPVDSGNSTIWLIGASVVIFSSIGALVFFMRGRGEDYYDDDDDYYDED